MVMKTVICLSFIALNNFLQTCVRALLGGQKGVAPPKQNSSPQTAQHTHPNFRYPYSSFKMVDFFFLETNRDLEET